MPQHPIATTQTDVEQQTDICLRSLDLFNSLLLNREAVYQTLKETSPAGIPLFQEPNSDKSERVESGHHYTDPIDAVEQDEDMPPKKPGIQVIGRRPASKEKTGTASGKGMPKTSFQIVSRGTNSTPRPSPLPSPSRAPQVSAHMTSAANGLKVAGDDQDVITKPKDPPREVAAQARSKTKSKRSTSGGDDVERPSKNPKSTPKANSSKRVNGTDASLGDPFVISDDGGETEKPEYHHRTESLAPLRRLKVGTPASDDDLKPSSSLTSNRTCLFTYDLERARIEAKHAKEMADLHRRLDASKAEGRKIKSEAKQACVELQRRQDATHDKETAVLKKQLDDERLKCSNLSKDSENLRYQLAESQKSEAKLQQDRDETEHLYKTQQTITDSLNRESTRLQNTACRKEQDLTSQISSLTTSLDLLKQEATKLQHANAALKAIQPPQPSLSPLSMLSIPPSIPPSVRPTPLPTTPLYPWPLNSLQSTPPSLRATPTPLTPPISSISPLSQTPPTAPSSPQAQAQTSDHRLTNMRKTYVALKKKHDMLSSAAMNLATLTRGWDHAAFGEFGRGLRQLAAVLGEEAGAVGAVEVVEEERDEKIEKEGMSVDGEGGDTALRGGQGYPP